MGKKGPLEERFWAKVDKGDGTGCWRWTGGTCKGYGTMWDASIGHASRANRISWLIHNGPIPDGAYVLHKCDTPACVRPDHLWLGTQRQNIADCQSKGRFHPGRHLGEHHPRTKLKDSDIAEIRKLCSNGITQSIVAERFEVTQSCVSAIVCRTSWKHIP